ncbi:MAG: hypothetical protein O7D30_12110 [Rickettsia endosymbiont of Ixodes persulcatus]|nr:hypothetical protein [Rickettsia endosymbiont of Ixodes persulcatus]
MTLRDGGKGGDGALSDGLGKVAEIPFKATYWNTGMAVSGMPEVFFLLLV